MSEEAKVESEQAESLNVEAAPTGASIFESEKDEFSAVSHPELQPKGCSPYEIDIQRQIISAFNVFDPDKARKITASDAGSVIRALGCFPNEEELRDLLAEIEEVERPEYVHLPQLLPVMTKVLLEDKFRPSPVQTLLQAFQVLDEEKKGFLEAEKISDLLSDYGEQFDEEEIREFLTASKEPDTEKVDYRKFCELLDVPEIMSLLFM